MKLIARFVLWVSGWKAIGGLPEDVKKCVIIVAPHTSMWDFVWGRLSMYTLNLKARFMIKKEIFWTGLGAIIKAFGGIPIDRSKGRGVVDEVAAVFNEHESMCLVITPEGTRKRVEKWKKGFYYIALAADVPVAMGIIDYKNKVCEIRELIYPTGDYIKDFGNLDKYYKGKFAKHPERFNLTQ